MVDLVVMFTKSKSKRGIIKTTPDELAKRKKKKEEKRKLRKERNLKKLEEKIDKLKVKKTNIQEGNFKF
jgi:hypothetical protein